MAASTSAQQLDLIQKIYHQALVETAKAIRAAGTEGDLASKQESVISNPRIPSCTVAFNSALDKLELEIVMAREVLGRDLERLRASRRPPAPEPELVAPAAMMVVDLEPVNMPKGPSPSNPPAAPFPPVQNPARPAPANQQSKPVAPFPEMGGFDLTVSPVVSHTPSPKTVVKAALPKKSPRPAPAAGAVGKALNAPPRKETKVPLPPTARPMPTPPSATQARAPARPAPMQSVTPIPIPVPPTLVPPPTRTPVAPVQTPVPIPTPGLAPPPAPAQTTAPVAAMAPTGPENIFTDMTFSLAPPAAEAQTANNAHLGDIDLTALGNGDLGNLGNLGINGFPGGGGGDGGGGGNGAPDADMDLGELDNHETAMATANAKLFDMGPSLLDNMDIDYDLGGDNGDNSNFNDMYFNDDNMASGEFDTTYFGI